MVEGDDRDFCEEDCSYITVCCCFYWAKYWIVCEVYLAVHAYRNTANTKTLNPLNWEQSEIKGIYLTGNHTLLIICNWYLIVCICIVVPLTQEDCADQCMVEGDDRDFCEQDCSYKKVCCCFYWAEYRIGCELYVLGCAWQQEHCKYKGTVQPWTQVDT